MQRRFAIAILNAKLTLFRAILNQFVFKVNNCLLKCFDTFKTCLVRLCILEQTALRMSLLGCKSLALLISLLQVTPIPGTSLSILKV